VTVSQPAVATVDSGWWDESAQAFLQMWPPTLSAEVERQRGERGEPVPPNDLVLVRHLVGPRHRDRARRGTGWPS
jgi:hypothetical protein